MSFWGYRYIWVNGKRVFEHRHVMSLMLGRPLTRKEVVHHKDENKLNNSPSNLELLPSQSAHKSEKHRIRFADDTHKECSKCEKIKPREEFCRRGKGGHNTDPHHAYCRKCQAKVMKARRKKKLGKCTECGRSPIYLQSKGMCATCVNKEWRDANRDRYNAWSRERRKKQLSNVS